MKLGIIGYRGMVGQVLLDRMNQEGDFKEIYTTFYGDSETGQAAPKIAGECNPKVEASNDLDSLLTNDVLISLKGGEYSTEIYPMLEKQGFNGIWIDASSAFRLDTDACLVLDPLNQNDIESSLKKGVKKFVGANCTVSLLLLALQGLIEKGEIEWVSTMSYQAASGAGAEGINGLIEETKRLTKDFQMDESALLNEKKLTAELDNLEKPFFGSPLSFNLIPYIDGPREDGSTKEEFKAFSESQKILGTRAFPIDGVCVRVPSLRAHAQALVIKTKTNFSAKEVEEILKEGNSWLKVIPNTPEDTKRELNPKSVSGKLDIHIGRVKKLKLGDGMVAAFTVGDQLLWGAAEPLRRVFKYYKELMS